MTPDDPRPAVRRQPGADLGDAGQDEGLAWRIRAEVRATGPMPFARFMELALYDPAGGYYRAAEARPGRSGDFLTAPELHPIFGAALATGLHEIWARLGRPATFTICEHGAGSGALALAILGALDDPAFATVLRYRPIEVDPRRLSTLRQRLAEAGLDRHLDTGDGPFEGVVLANEVLDALPVHRVRRRGHDLRELAVDLDADGAFVEVETAPSTPALEDRLRSEGIELRDEQLAEICLALDRWVAAAAAPLRRGVFLVIDYGAPAVELYDPVRRPGGTLRAYVRHHVHGDPYRHVGRQDLTAHVDVTAVEAAAWRAGLTTIGITTQAEALMGLGIEDRLRAVQDDPATTAEAYLLLRASLMRLLDPAAMGRFRVLAFGRDWPEDPAGPPLGLFRFRLPERRSRARTSD